MSPTVFREGKYRFYFFSKEETKIHIHVISQDSEAKYWLEPMISLADYTGFSNKQLNFIQKAVEGHKNEIIEKWEEHFKPGNK